jgi:PST family polysaccharide transporter
MVAIMALSIPLRALSIVPEASMAALMRFRVLALIQLGITTGLISLQVICALLGFEAYSFVIPHPIVFGLSLIAMIYLARPPLRLNPQLRRWRYLIGDASRLFFSNFSNWVTSQFGFVVLGLFQSATAVGLFFFGLRLSVRTIVLLIGALRNVLLPALRKIHENPKRQARAFLRSARLLALIGTPGCALQAALAEPGFQLLLPDDKYGAIAVVQALSIGAVFQLVSQPSLQLLRAQGRLSALLVQSIVFSALFVVTVTIAAIFGAQVHVAIGVLLFYLITGPTQMYLAVSHGECGWRDVASVFARPIIFSVIAFGGTWLAGQALDESTAADITRVVGIPLIGSAIYLALTARFAPADFKDLWERIMNTVGRRRNQDVHNGETDAVPMHE